MDPEQYDLVILGGGSGSTIAAWTFAKQGQRVAAIDRKYIGGSCPNIACLPSKNIIHSAKVASYFGRSKEFGLVTKGFAIDMSGVRDRKRRMVSGLINAHLDHYKGSGAELIPRLWPFHRSQDFGSHITRRNNSSTSRDQCDHRYW